MRFFGFQKIKRLFWFAEPRPNRRLGNAREPEEGIKDTPHSDFLPLDYDHSSAKDISMKKLLLAASMLTALALPAGAATIDDPLHLTCLVGCTSNGTTIDIGNPPLNFGVQSSPQQDVAGPLYFDFLVPTTYGIIPSISVTGSLYGATSFTASLVSSTAWTTGDLADYLAAYISGFAASPENPISAFLDSGAGFYVYQGLAGIYTLPQQGTLLSLGTTPLWSVTGGVPNGTGITAFFDDGALGGTLIATANSSSLHAVPGPIVGAGIPGLVMAVLGMFGLNRARRRRAAAA